MRPPSAKKLQEQVDRFNSRYPVGQKVAVKKDDGSGIETVTRGPAFILGGHSAVISMEGISGCSLLDRVTPIVGTAT
jgi:hypothetical protein